MDRTTPRRTAVATCLFVGGLAVGSLQSRGEAPAHAATTDQERTPSAAKKEFPLALARGAESPALKALREPTKRAIDPDMGDIEPPAWARKNASFGPYVNRSEAIPGGRHEAAAVVSDPDDMFAGLRMPELPVRRHPRVMRYLSYFAESVEGRGFMVEALRRMGRVEEIVAKSLRELSLPQALAAVALVESGFSPTAVSPAGAAGMWQFMPGTARAYGLVVERSFDERAGLWRSTDAATHHLSDLYERFRSWDLVFAAYNLGYEGLTRRMEELGTDDFWAIADVPGALPKETAHYVPKVLAVAIILCNLQELGFADIDREPAVSGSELEVPSGTRLAIIARAAGTSVRALHELNPELLEESVPDRGGAITLHIPRDGLSRARVMLPRLLSDPDPTGKEVSADFDWGKDDVADSRSRLEKSVRTPFFRSRDAASRAALGARGASDEKQRSAFARFKARHLMPASHAQRETAKEPLADADREPVLPLVAPPAAPAPLPAVVQAAPRAVLYRVSASDTPASIAKTFGLSVDELLSQSNLAAPDELKPDMLLEIVPAPRAMKKLQLTATVR